VTAGIREKNNRMPGLPQARAIYVNASSPSLFRVDFGLSSLTNADRHGPRERDVSETQFHRPTAPALLAPPEERLLLTVAMLLETHALEGLNPRK